MVDVLTGNMYYYGNDKLGTPQIMTDSTNTVVWEGEYKPFGEADVNPNSSIVNNFRFPGQYFDSETELHYNYHRYYDPKTGRYVTPDPIGLAGGINLYGYALNNPVNLIDPSGLITLGDLVGAATTVATTSAERAGMPSIVAFGLTVITAPIGDLISPDSTYNSEHLLKHKKGMAEADRLLKEVKKLNEQLDYICLHTGGCKSDEDPCD